MRHPDPSALFGGIEASGTKFVCAVRRRRRQRGDGSSYNTQPEIVCAAALGSGRSEGRAGTRDGCRCERWLVVKLVEILCAAIAMLAIDCVTFKQVAQRWKRV